MGKIEKKPEVSIVIGGYNEEKKIEKSLDVILNFFKKRKEGYEIIFVDDGSTDETLQRVLKYAKGNKNVTVIANRKNHGKGYVVRQGILAAKGDFIIVTDADLAYPIEQVETFLNAIKNYDIVVGTRIHKKSIYIMNYKSFKLLLLRHIISRTFNLYVRCLFRLLVTDTQCGLKVFRGEVAKKIARVGKIDGFSYDVENFVIARRSARIQELPVTVIHSYADSKVKIFKHTVKMFFEILQIKWYESIGLYSKRTR